MMNWIEILDVIFNYLPWIVGTLSLITVLLSLIRFKNNRRKAYEGMNIKFQEMEKRVEKRISS